MEHEILRETWYYQDIIIINAIIVALNRFAELFVKDI